jgi:hypothetical protein
LRRRPIPSHQSAARLPRQKLLNVILCHKLDELSQERWVCDRSYVLYLISGFRWSFYDFGDVSVDVSLTMTMLFLALCLAVVWWIFRTGYRLKN